MGTALYYGLSTIAQTLAGAIALLGALVLYKLQALSSAMKEPAAHLCREFHIDRDGAAELQHLLIAEDFAAIESVFRNGRYMAQLERNAGARNAHVTLTRLLLLRNTLVTSLKQALQWTASLISASVFTLFTIPFIEQHRWLALVTATAGCGVLVQRECDRWGGASVYYGEPVGRRG